MRYLLLGWIWFLLGLLTLAGGIITKDSSLGHSCLFLLETILFFLVALFYFFQGVKQ